MISSKARGLHGPGLYLLFPPEFRSAALERSGQSFAAVIGLGGECALGEDDDHAALALDSAPLDLLCDLALTCGKCGDRERSAELYAQAYAMRLVSLGAEHEKTAETLALFEEAQKKL